MADAHALIRVLDELVWVLRREGFDVSTSQAIDLVRAVRALGFERRDDVRTAIACVVVPRSCERARFDAVFDAFFAGAPRGASANMNPWERLAARGFTDAEIDVVRAFLTELGPTAAALRIFLDGGADLDRRLARSDANRVIDAYSAAQLGYQTHRLLRELGAGTSERTLAALRSHLVDALGARGAELAEALAEDLARGHERARAYLRGVYERRVDDAERRRQDGGLIDTPLTSLSAAGIDEVRLAVRRFAERLRASARARARRARRGSVDSHRTLRQGLRSGGVPLRLVWKRRFRHRPKLVLLCDVSDSVRATAVFFLEFVYTLQEIFDDAKSFVFVSEIGETTSLFDRERPSLAVARAWQGAGLVRASENSNYGRVLRAFEARWLRDVDRRTTVVILGDGRTNYRDAAPEVLDRIRARARALIWLCPEPRGLWADGDSAMTRYAPRCTAVYEVRCAADLERAARSMIARG